MFLTDYPDVEADQSCLPHFFFFFFFFFFVKIGEHQSAKHHKTESSIMVAS